MKIPSLWEYNREDKTTWRYLGFILKTERSTGKQIFIWIKNPKFKYGHLAITVDG